MIITGCHLNNVHIRSGVLHGSRIDVISEFHCVATEVLDIQDNKLEFSKLRDQNLPVLNLRDMFILHVFLTITFALVPLSAYETYI